MYHSEFCNVSYHETLNAVFVKWKKFCCLDDYRKPLLFALDIIRNRHDCHYIADTREGFENERADTEWLFNEWLPQLSLTTCKMIFFIIDKDNTLKEELEGQSVELKKLFDVIYCFGLDEVKTILEKRRAPLPSPIEATSL